MYLYLPAPNAFSDLKTKIKNLLKGKKSKQAEDKPVEATKTEEPVTNGTTATEAAPAEPTPAVSARKSWWSDPFPAYADDSCPSRRADYRDSCCSGRANSSY
jgi:hypothetical protein